MWYIQNFCTVEGNVKRHHHFGKSSGDKTKHTPNPWPSHSMPRYLLKKMKTYMHVKTNSQIFIAAVFLIGPN